MGHVEGEKIKGRGGGGGVREVRGRGEVRERRGMRSEGGV